MSLTTTSNRRRISTLYAGMHMSRTDRESFYKHMGHTKVIDVDNYHCPADTREVRVMGECWNICPALTERELLQAHGSHRGD